ncbi:MAG: pyrroline-5-carboxylate reductase [Salinibacterium sp.]|nr:MAG: pyrroline-5-carboxylate reductase [Salinibacterium sp.]
MTTTLPSIAIIGAGAMGGAILNGLLGPGVSVASIRVTNRGQAKAAVLERPGVESLAIETTPDANRRAVAGARLVVIGVKPAMVPDALAEIADALDPDALVISVAAGVTTATMEGIVSTSVLRAMPNTPALIGRAVTGLAGGSRATGDDLAIGRALFETVGTVVELPESQIDALSTISGSGPAYVFYLIEELTRTAVDMGFSADIASLLVEGTFAGSIELLTASAKTPAELRRQVTSPKGTTERAIAELERADLKAIFDRATGAALARARELAAGG